MHDKPSSSARCRLLATLAAFGLTVVFVGGVPIARSQKISNLEIEQGRDMLRQVKSELGKNYYDPSFHGFDPEARFKQADEMIKKAQSQGQVFGIIAQALLELNDSHTIFFPPRRTARVEYGWQMKAVGDGCYVSAIKPGSDAEAKGLRVGDKVLSIDGRPLDRSKVWLAKYLYYTLRPQPGMALVVEKPDGQQQQLVVQAKVRELKKILNFTGSDNGEDVWNEIREGQAEDRLNRHRFHEMGEDLFIWKMPQFDLMEEEVGDKVGKFRNHKALILDLRGNGGGYVKTLEWLAGHFFPQDIKIAELNGRKKRKPITAKGRGDQIFKGQLVVLVDGDSGSAAELFARLVQLEKRGTVIGDRSAGAVMQSMYYPLQLGVDKVISFGLSITNADVIMADGKSLEHNGVTPNELVLPSAADMANRRDPVMTRAAALVGVNLDPEKAGSLFPIEWRK
jgi:C-terminal processing protease CtpA/Prc